MTVTRRECWPGEGRQQRHFRETAGPRERGMCGEALGPSGRWGTTCTGSVKSELDP